MPTYYAWSKFVTETNEYGQAKKTLMPGEKVTQDKLGVDDTEWEYLIEVGAVSEEEYPDVPDDVSPAEWRRAQTTVPVEIQEEVDLRQVATGTVAGEAVNKDTVKASSPGK